MRKPRGLKLRRYSDHLIDINEYLNALPEAKASDNIGEMELHENILNSMPNGWSKSAYVQGFIVKLLLLKYDNMFECMEISEIFYEVVVETYYKKNDYRR